MDHYDAVVVGCGVAGLAALAELNKYGMKVIGLEGNNHIGGRVHSMEFGDGVVEMGAEWLHGSVANPAYELAVKNDVKLLNQDIAYRFHRSDGSMEHQALCKELLDFCYISIDSAPPLKQKLGDYVKAKFRDFARTKVELRNDEDFCKGFLLLMELIVCNYDASNSWNDLTIRGSNSFQQLEGHQNISWHRIGYKTLFDLILKEDGRPEPEILCNKTVRKISWDVDGRNNVVQCDDGSKYVADTVIVTVSLGVLKERYATLFSPKLPEVKVRAIKALSIGVVDKICLKYNEVWWQKEVSFHGFIWKGEDLRDLPQCDQWLTRILGFSTPMGSDNVITLWTSGDSAKLAEVMPRQELLAKCRMLLQKFMGPDVQVPPAADMKRSTWYQNPLTRGSYSFRGLDWEDNEEACPDLIQPLTNKKGDLQVLFAGEATSIKYFSTVHGAIESGRREAKRLINLHKSKI